MATLTEFAAAINQISSERGVDPEKIFQAVEEALVTAYKKQTGKKDAEDITASIDRETGEFVIFEDGSPVQVEELGRIATQVAKQVVLQKLRESEKEAILKEYENRVGEIFTAVMQRMKQGSVLFELGKATAVMPKEEQIPGEFYRIGDRYKVLLKKIDTESGKNELVVSRADEEFLIGLFKNEVPEIADETIEVKAVAREAGFRSKIAVVSHQEGVDPIGSCVGQRGVRIANVMSEIGNEKIDIIQWDKDPVTFIGNCLSPAQVESVTIEGDVAVVVVPEDQLSLAIGKDGQNARLAAKLAGVKIKIVGPDGSVQNEIAEESDQSMTSSKQGDGLSSSLMKKLQTAGVSVEQVKEMSIDELMELQGIGKVTAQKIYNALHEE